MEKKEKLSLPQVISMAVGTMIGASIFSIFGLGVKIAGDNLPLAFILSGIYALLVAYSYAHLGKKIISNAGPIAFIKRAFGDSPLLGTLSILMWLSFVISLSLFAIGFAGYFLPLFKINSPTLMVFIEVILIIFFGSLNYFGGSKAVGNLEFWIVTLKLLILGIFIVANFMVFHPEYIHFHFDDKGIKGILYASIIFFLSYMGFGLVTNMSENMENPEENVPKAIYISIFIVMLVYVLIALSALGAVPKEVLIKYQENALAIAAKPALGNFGFFLLTLGALISTSSALNATLFGAANLACALMREGKLPHKNIFLIKKWHGKYEGLYLTCLLAIVFCLFFNISSVASIISLIFSVIYLFVILSHLRLIHFVGGHKGIVFISLLTISTVIINLFAYQYKSDKKTFFVSILIFILAYLVETYIYRKKLKRKMLIVTHT